MNKTLILSILLLMTLISCTFQPTIINDTGNEILNATILNETNIAKPISTITIIPTPYYGNLTIYFIDVGQGDSTLIVSPNNKTMLIDGGEKNKGIEIVSFIRNLGINKIDYVLATHADADHIGGLPYINLKLKPELVIDNGLSKDTQIYKEYNNSITNKKIIYIDSQFDFDDNIITSFIVSYDDGLGYSSNHNDNSIILKLDYKNTSFLFTGDCEEECESRIGDSDLDSDVYKIGHHGSKTSSSMYLLNKITPKISVISAGLGNQYGHPHNEVLERLKFINSKVYRTDLQGNIIITTDGGSISTMTTR